MRASSPMRRAGTPAGPLPPPPPPPPSWPSLAHKAGALFERWSSAAADARAALALAAHVRARLPLLLQRDDGGGDANNDDSPWSACGRALRHERTDVRDRVIDAHLRDVEEELRRAAAARAGMAEAARALGRLAASAAAAAAGAVPSSSAAVHHPLAPGPAPLEVAETLQDLWRACAAETQLHEAAAARCVLPGAAAAEAAVEAGWAAALAVLEAEPNVDRARFEAFFDAVRQAWPS